MVQVRKLVLAIAAASALSSGMAQALGLGELTLKSTQNQPLLAEIELLDVKDLNAAEVVPSLASAQDFAKEGVPRPAFLDDLRFTPVINPDGKSVLRVTSSQPLSEPFVKFLVQVMWPNGRLLRDYSVLLDPAKFSPQTAAAASAAAPASKSAQYTTSARDTLWEIAAKARNGASVQQTMLAIQALNPDAFINGNINRLKTGQVLRLPEAAQTAELPRNQAIAEVARQNADWRNGRRTVPLTRQLDATGRKPAAATPASASGSDKLSLVSGQAASDAGKGAAGDAKQLNEKLAMTQEGLDSSRRENAELQSRMKDLQSQLDKLQRLIELKNDQLAKLQADNTAGEAVAAVPAQLAAQAADAPEADIAPVTEGVPATAVPPAPDTGEVKSEERNIQDLLASPLLLGLVGGSAILVLLLLMLLLARRRKAQQAAEKHLRMAKALEEESDFTADLEMPESSFEGLEVVPPNVKLDPAPVPAPAPAPVVVPVVVPQPATEPVADVLVQAEQLIGQRQWQPAVELLAGAIEREPQRSDLRLKLMQVYGELGERDAFVVQERQLIANGKNHAEVEQLKNRYPGMVVAAAAGIATAAVAAELEAQFVKELLLDEPVADSKLEPGVEPAPVPEPVVDEFDQDFDLSLDELEAASPAVLSPEPELDNGSSESVDDTLSFESVLAQQAQVSSEDLPDFDLDLSADELATPSLAEEDLLGLEEQLKDFSVSESPLSDITGIDDLDLPEDFDLSLADEDVAPAVAPDSFSAELDEVNAELERLSQSLEQPPIAEPFVDTVKFDADDAVEQGDEPEFDFLSGTDETATKLDLAQAYIDMGDDEGARDILGEVLSEGNAEQKSEAQEMLSRLT